MKEKLMNKLLEATKDEIISAKIGLIILEWLNENRTPETIPTLNKLLEAF